MLLIGVAQACPQTSFASLSPVFGLRLCLILLILCVRVAYWCRTGLPSNFLRFAQSSCQKGEPRITVIPSQKIMMERIKLILPKFVAFFLAFRDFSESPSSIHKATALGPYLKS